MTDDEARLLERLLAGEQRAFAELVQRYQGAMRAVAYAIAGQRHAQAVDAQRPQRIVATAALGGLETYDLSGKRVGTTPAGEVAAVDAAYDVALGKRTATVLAAALTAT